MSGTGGTKGGGGQDGGAPGTGGAGGSAAGCAETIDAFCASDGGGFEGPCIRDWTSAQQDTALWCSGGSYRVSLYHCDGVGIVRRSAIDTATFYYYDLASSMLVRVEDVGLGPVSCVAGQAIAPLTGCPDAGVPPSICPSADAGSD